jgi:two-component system KDP operon response regulator KdpE
MKDSILLIEDDLTIQTMVRLALSSYQVFQAPTLQEAKSLLKDKKFSAILIDIGLPDGDGLRLLNELASQNNRDPIPLLILSGKSDISNKVAAFSFGAEDFIAKPFDPLELQARVSAKIRKNQERGPHRGSRAFGDLILDLDRQKAFHQDKGIETDLQLTSLELRILNLLTHRLENVYSREQILQQVWGDTFVSDRTVDSHIAHLRAKIRPTHLNVETAKNFGYRAVLRPPV